MSNQAHRWWPGVLAVEGLALDAVDLVCRAVSDLSALRGRPREVSTSPELVAASFAAIEHLRVDGRAAEGWAPLSGFVKAADGWVRLHGNYPHHAAAITRALDARTRDELTSVVAALPMDEVEERVTMAGGIATTVRTEAQWSTHPHAVATADDPWHTAVLADERPELGHADLPLAGVRVLDLTRVIAGPTCSQLLACLGADVLRLDPPHRPELLDQYLSNAMGKRSAEVDLNDDAKRIRECLLPHSDVVLVGYRPGSLARYGLDPETLVEDNPQLVVASLSAWGERGPWSQRSGFDSIVQAATGMATVCGSMDRPGALPVQALDHATGYTLAAEVISLLARARGGLVRASLLGAARSLLARPRDRVEHTAELDVPTVNLDSPYGPVTAVPPPLLLDGQTVERDLRQYGASALAWVH